MPEYNRMQIIKRRFFAMRNGIIADTLRKAGLEYKIIFGLNLPQITEIAAEQPHEADLAEELWADRRTRESLMLAPMLYPAADMDSATAARWIRTAPTTEVADVLCLKLLRHIPEAIHRSSRIRRGNGEIYSPAPDVQPSKYSLIPSRTRGRISVTERNRPYYAPFCKS